MAVLCRRWTITSLLGLLFTDGNTLFFIFFFFNGYGFFLVTHFFLKMVTGISFVFYKVCLEDVCELWSIPCLTRFLSHSACIC